MHAHARRIGDPARDRVADVVQLHVEKNPLAGARERAGERQPARERQLIADLVEAAPLAQAIDHRRGGAHVVEVERDDQPLARLHAASPHANRPARSTSLPTTRLSSADAASSLSSSMSSNAVAAPRTAICSGSTSAPQPSSSVWRSAMSERMPPRVPLEAAPSANTRSLKAASGASLPSRTREIQSMVFLSSGVSEALYSGLAMKMP